MAGSWAHRYVDGRLKAGSEPPLRVEARRAARNYALFQDRISSDEPNSLLEREATPGVWESDQRNTVDTVWRLTYTGAIAAEFRLCGVSKNRRRNSGSRAVRNGLDGLVKSSMKRPS